jgi:hypothetical protein
LKPNSNGKPDTAYFLFTININTMKSTQPIPKFTGQLSKSLENIPPPEKDIILERFLIFPQFSRWEIETLTSNDIFFDLSGP